MAGRWTRLGPHPTQSGPGAMAAFEAKRTPCALPSIFHGRQGSHRSTVKTASSPFQSRAVRIDPAPCSCRASIWPSHCHRPPPVPAAVGPRPKSVECWSERGGLKRADRKPAPNPGQRPPGKLLRRRRNRRAGTAQLQVQAMLAESRAQRTVGTKILPGRRRRRFLHQQERKLQRRSLRIPSLAGPSSGRRETPLAGRFREGLSPQLGGRGRVQPPISRHRLPARTPIPCIAPTLRHLWGCPSFYLSRPRAAGVCRIDW